MTDTNSPSVYPPLIISILIAVLPILVLLIYFPSSYYALISGAIVWILSVILKLVLSATNFVKKVLQLGHAMAVIWGAISGLTELGLAALCIFAILDGVPLASVLAFGFGAASTEIVYVLAKGIQEHYRNSDPEAYQQWLIGARQSLWVQYMLAIERFSASLGHVATRGLVYISVVFSFPLAFVLALISFIIVDGLATYGRMVGWNWFEPATTRRFYQVVLIVSLLDTAIFLIYWFGVQFDWTLHWA